MTVYKPTRKGLVRARADSTCRTPDCWRIHPNHGSVPFMVVDIERLLDRVDELEGVLAYGVGVADGKLDKTEALEDALRLLLAWGNHVDSCPKRESDPVSDGCGDEADDPDPVAVRAFNAGMTALGLSDQQEGKRDV